MIRIRVREGARGEWRQVDDGLVPVTAEELRAMRRRFAVAYAALQDVDDTAGNCAGGAPQTVARAIVRDVCPRLSGFDLIAIGFAVTAPRIEVDGKRWPVDKALAEVCRRARA